VPVAVVGAGPVAALRAVLPAAVALRAVLPAAVALRAAAQRPAAALRAVRPAAVALRVAGAVARRRTPIRFSRRGTPTATVALPERNSTRVRSAAVVRVPAAKAAAPVVAVPAALLHRAAADRAAHRRNRRERA
jgi:hypothetical protein